MPLLSLTLNPSTSDVPNLFPMLFVDITVRLHRRRTGTTSHMLWRYYLLRVVLDAKAAPGRGHWHLSRRISHCMSSHIPSNFLSLNCRCLFPLPSPRSGQSKQDFMETPVPPDSEMARVRTAVATIAEAVEVQLMSIPEDSVFRGKKGESALIFPSFVAQGLHSEWWELAESSLPDPSFCCASFNQADVGIQSRWILEEHTGFHFRGK